ncbi:hybrid sensor histidine kinase/response regulator [Burkholderia alba]|uniref:hybrid sensor histidine kinase/response regulator n=1 Tax=Burkholderia alba TaxID=2683677 RepID=UPI002B05D2B9|nr:ATP-binding protein [Burkholderia alba]
MKIFGQPADDRMLAFVGIVLAAITVLWLYFGYALVSLAPPSLTGRMEQQENYYIPVSQFEQAALKAETAMLLYSVGRGGFDDVDIKFQILKAKLARLSVPSDSTFLLLQTRGYASTVTRLGDITATLENGLAAARRDPAAAYALAGQFRRMSEPLSDLEMNVGNAEGLLRDRMYSDYSHRRRALMSVSIGVLLVFIGLVSGLVLNARRLRALMLQQRAALVREQEAAHAATEAVNARNAFLGMVGHELRTPLQSITAAIDVLAERTFEPQDQLIINRLSRAADQLDAQMKDLTDLSRLDAGKLALRRQPFTPRDVLLAAIESVADRAKRKGLSFVHTVPDDEAVYVSDPYRIQQIVTNLLTNAIKYTERGSVSLRATLLRGDQRDQLAVEIEDTGPGFPQEQAARIFQPFTQLDSSSTRRHDGVGMGLAIVRGLLNLLGGSITVASTVGAGATFNVVLPLERAAPSTAAADDEPDRPRRLDDKTVLVVDDQETVRESLRTMLAAIGVRFELAASADEALLRLAYGRFDALLLDINMPDKDGIAVAQTLTATDGPNRHIPIVALSAIGPEALSCPQRDLFEQYLMKPIRSDDLKRGLEALFARGGR